jgi:hypothetical protein
MATRQDLESKSPPGDPSCSPLSHIPNKILQYRIDTKGIFKVATLDGCNFHQSVLKSFRGVFLGPTSPERLKELLAATRLYLRLVQEVFHLSPLLLVEFVAARILNQLMPTLELLLLCIVLDSVGPNLRAPTTC